MTPNETKLLTLLLAETRRIETDDIREYAFRSAGRLTAMIAQEDMTDGLGVRVAGHWLGSDPAGRQARRRALMALEVAGLVELSCRWSQYPNARTTHARLTDQGRIVAESFAQAASETGTKR